MDTSEHIDLRHLSLVKYPGNCPTVIISINGIYVTSPFTGTNIAICIVVLPSFILFFFLKYVNCQYKQNNNSAPHGPK